MKIFPSIISADVLRLRDVVSELDAYVDGYHIDIMDDHFVPNLTWGPVFVNALRQITKRPFQVHLMVDNPHMWVDRLDLKAGDSFVFHVEAVFPRAISTIFDALVQRGWKRGLAINPKTPIDTLLQKIELLDEILVMSVEPGFSGQAFIDTTHRVKKVRDFCLQAGLKVPLMCMDGGINSSNISVIAAASVQLVGVANAVFNGGNPVQNIQNLRQLANPCSGGC